MLHAISLDSIVDLVSKMASHYILAVFRSHQKFLKEFPHWRNVTEHEVCPAASNLSEHIFLFASLRFFYIQKQNQHGQIWGPFIFYEVGWAGWIWRGGMRKKMASEWGHLKTFEMS